MLGQLLIRPENIFMQKMYGERQTVYLVFARVTRQERFVNYIHIYIYIYIFLFVFFFF